MSCLESVALASSCASKVSLSATCVSASALVTSCVPSTSTAESNYYPAFAWVRTLSSMDDDLRVRLNGVTVYDPQEIVASPRRFLLEEVNESDLIQIDLYDGMFVDWRKFLWEIVVFWDDGSAHRFTGGSTESGFSSEVPFYFENGSLVVERPAVCNSIWGTAPVSDRTLPIEAAPSGYNNVLRISCYSPASSGSSDNAFQYFANGTMFGSSSFYTNHFQDVPANVPPTWPTTQPVTEVSVNIFTSFPGRDTWLVTKSTEPV